MIGMLAKRGFLAHRLREREAVHAGHVEVGHQHIEAAGRS